MLVSRTVCGKCFTCVKNEQEGSATCCCHLYTYSFQVHHSVLHIDKGIAKQLRIYNNEHQSTKSIIYIYICIYICSIHTYLRTLCINIWIWINTSIKYMYHYVSMFFKSFKFVSNGKVYHMLTSSQLPFNANHLQPSPAKKLKSRILPQTCHDTMCFADRQDQPWWLHGWFISWGCLTDGCWG